MVLARFIVCSSLYVSKVLRLSNFTGQRGVCVVYDRQLNALLESNLASNTMKRNPYLTDCRMQDVIAAIQFLGNYEDYDLTETDFRKRIAINARSANSWGDVFAEHPEFFRKSEHADDYSLILRRAKQKTDDKLRPPLTSSELSMLVDTAIHLQKQALEMHRERRAWVPLLMSGIGIVAALAGTIIGSLLRKV